MSSIDRYRTLGPMGLGSLVSHVEDMYGLAVDLGFDLGSISDCAQLHSYLQAKGFDVPILTKSTYIKDVTVYTPIYIPYGNLRLDRDSMPFSLIPIDAETVYMAIPSITGTCYVWADSARELSMKEINNRISRDFYEQISIQERGDIPGKSLSWDDDDHDTEILFRSGLVELYLSEKDWNNEKTIHLKGFKGTKLVSAIGCVRDYLALNGELVEPHSIFEELYNHILQQDIPKDLGIVMMSNRMTFDQVNDVISKYMFNKGFGVSIYNRTGYSIFPAFRTECKSETMLLVFNLNNYKLILSSSSSDCDIYILDDKLSKSGRSSQKKTLQEEIAEAEMTEEEVELEPALETAGSVVVSDSVNDIKELTNTVYLPEKQNEENEYLPNDEEYTSTESCCARPDSVSDDNIPVMSWCLKDFKGKRPTVNCLKNALKNSSRFMSYILNKDNYGPDDLTHIDCYAKFRHDYMAYIVLNFVKSGSKDYEFGTDFKFPSEIKSRRTPDVIDIEGNRITIFEMTVVMSYNRGLFLKGFNNETSKYRREIRELKSKGYEVIYHPVIISINDGLDVNLSRLSFIFDTKVSKNAEEIFSDYYNLLTSEYNPLIAMVLDKGLVRDHPDASEKIERLMVNKPWKYISIKANKVNWYRAVRAINTTMIEDASRYKLLFSKGSSSIRQSGMGVQGSDINNYKAISSELAVYNCFFSLNDQLIGNDEVFIMSYNDLVPVESSLEPHGEVTESRLRATKSGVVSNLRQRSVFSLEDSQRLDIDNMNSKGMDGLNHKLTRDDVISAVDRYRKDLSFNNHIDHNATPPKIYNPRRSFNIIANTTLISKRSYSLGFKYSIREAGCSTSVKLILQEAERIKLSFKKISLQDDKDVESLLHSLRDINKEYHSIMVGNEGKAVKYNHFVNKHPNLKAVMMKLKDDRLKTQIEIRKLDKRVPENRITATSQIRSSIKSEMSWNKNSGYNIYGLAKGTTVDLDEFSEYMWMNSKKLEDNFEMPSNIRDAKPFIQMKDKYNAEIIKFKSEIDCTNIYSNLLIMSSLSYSLLAISNQTSSSKYITLDNIGLDNCYLLVKGGQKMTRSRKTKIFKFIYPCDRVATKWNTSKRIFVKDGVTYEETPWQQWHQTVAMDYISAPHKLLIAYMSTREKHSEQDSKDILTLPLMLLLHNRRKTEEILHNLRYILANTLAEFTQIKSMLPVFATENYTYFEACIKKNLGENYLRYYDGIRAWSEQQSLTSGSFKEVTVTHPLMCRPIRSIDDFTFLIYGTYMMSKAPVEQTAEQSNNLKSVMATRLEYDEDDKSHEYNADSKDLLTDDFGYCPKTAYSVGKILSAKLKSKNSISAMHSGWNNIMHASVDRMANNRGLRGEDKDFFGQKGYYIVYKKMVESADAFKQVCDAVFDKDIDEKARCDRLERLNYDFASTQAELNLDQVIFHIVDKLQRGGGREIYVMDFTTKLYQYPIEKMFKLICTLFEEELISIPSSKRAGLIHTKVFEGVGKYTTYYLTLDCRKWAPRSSPEKYIYMLLGMSDSLPEDFIKATISYFLKHDKKRIYTRKRIFEAFVSNSENKKYEKFFTEDESKGGVYFDMPYSFVMGIFNLLSSLMHVGIQYYSKHIIESVICGVGEYCDLSMFGHSDDSAGRCSLSNKSMISAVLAKYEHLAKQVNHMMSLKKCNISEHYFELLSILYMHKQFLPLISKFVQNINLTTSGQGISSDFKEIISKSIELQSNGATISTAYMAQIVMSNMYRRFYRVTADLQLPSLGGFVTTMPHLYLTYGANADEVRLFRYDYPLFKRILGFVHEYMEYDVEDGMPMVKYIRQIRVPKKYQELKDKIILPEFEDNHWFFSNNKTNHTFLNLFWFRAKMENSDFATSLLNINEIKRYLDSLYMASGKKVITKGEPSDINGVINSIMASPDEFDTEKFESIITSQYDGLIYYYDFLDSHPELKFVHKGTYFDKPCRLIMTKYNSIPIKNYNSLNLSIELHRPELRRYTYSRLSYGNEIDSMRSFLDSLNVSKDMVSTKSFLDYAQKVQTKNITLYTRLPSDERVQYDEPGLHQYFIHSMHSKYTISGTSHRMVSPNKYTTVTSDIERSIKMNLSAFLLYRSVLSSRLEYLNEINLSREMGSIKLSDTFNHCLKDRSFDDFFVFLNYSILRGTTDLNLIGLNNISFWLKRQKRQGDVWVGTGNLIVKTGDCTLSFEVINNSIISCSHNMSSEIIFQQSSLYYLTTLFEVQGLSWLVTNYDMSDNKSLGLDKSGRLCYSENSRLGEFIPNCVFDPTMSHEIFSTVVTYSFIKGSHNIYYKNMNFKIETMDSVSYQKYGLLDLYEVIDVDSTDTRIVSQLCGVVLTSDPQIERDITYDLGDLYDKFTGSDLYKFCLSDMRKRGNKRMDIIQSFWSDVIQNIKSESDQITTLSEQLGVDNALSILPSYQKDTMNKLMLYNIDDKDILKKRGQILSMPIEEQRKEITNLINQVGSDKTALILLDDIGDYSQFKLHNFSHKLSDVPATYIYTFFDVLVDAVRDCIGFISNSVLSESVGELVNTDDVDKLEYYPYLPFVDLVTARGRDIFLSDITLVSNNILAFLRIIQIIFEDNNLFLMFSDKLGGTFLRKFPRSTQFLTEWKVLIFQMHKCMLKKYYSGESDIPSILLRFKKRLDTNTKKGKIFNLKWTQGNRKAYLNFNRSSEFGNHEVFLPVIDCLMGKLKNISEGSMPDDIDISEIYMDEQLCPKYTIVDQLDQEVYVRETLGLEIRLKNSILSSNLKKDREGMTTWSNSGEYYLALGPINIQQAFAQNITNSRFIPIISDTLIPNSLENHLNVYLMNGRAIGINTKCYIYLTLEVSIPSTIQKEMGIRRLTKKMYNKLSGETDEILLYINGDNDITLDDRSIYDALTTVSKESSKNITMIDIEKAIKDSEYIPSSFNPTLQSTYGQGLFDAITKQIELNQLEKLELTSIIKSSMAPISKYNNIKKIIIARSKRLNLVDDPLKVIMKEMITGDLPVDDMIKNKTEKAKYFINSARSKGENKHRLFMLTSEKAALKQLDDITGGSSLDILAGKVGIDLDTHQFMQDSLSLLIKSLGPGMKSVKSSAVFYKDILNSIEPKQYRNEIGDKVQKAVSNFINIYTEDGSGDEYEDYEEPQVSTNIMLGFRRG